MGHTKLVFDHWDPPTGKVEDCVMKNPRAGHCLLYCSACHHVPVFKSVPCDCGDTFFDDPVGEKPNA